MVAAVLAWGVLLALPVDAMENVLLWRLLCQPEDDASARRTRWLALVKFLLVGVAGFWAVVGLLFILSSRGPR